MWYLIVSIPDLCHLSYFGYIDLIFMVNVLYTRLNHEHYSKHRQTKSYKMVFERLAPSVGYTQVRLIARVGLIRETHFCPVISLATYQGRCLLIKIK